MTEALKFDAIVIGAGAGGCHAAARLAAAGRHTLLIDDHDYLGGRAGTEIIDGHKVNIGAIALEPGGVFEETFKLCGATLDIRQPTPPAVFYLNRKVVDVSKGGLGFLLNGVTKQASRVLDQFAMARTGTLPDSRESTEDWLQRYTGNKTVHAIFRNLCAAIFAMNSSEIPARAFLTYFTQKGAFKRFGFHPQGTMGAWQALADAVERLGGEVWLSSPAEKIEIENGQATAVWIRRNGGAPIRVEASTILFNGGPKALVGLTGPEALGADYVRQTEDLLKPAANIVFNFATREDLMPKAPGIMTFGQTRNNRLCNMANLTATCPELAPEGWHQYVAYAVPHPAIGDFDSDAEVNLALEDLREQFPGFDDKVKMLSVRVMRDDWPAQRSGAGYDMDVETPVRGLWCVGDAVKDYGNGGTQACAESARLAVTKALEHSGRTVPAS
ncbi:phytoene desaturase family protein [Seohaeicola zhoushanensis]|uniref:Oxidoreductase n=1 Tax=Seohaeicola zhoushanensis TaxID=1569283 RepID=A0A8J3M8R1_9RHOB|nr:FAD-dependent oxidoreductase [Seohaeicola zhoushanensis]GHF61988.1 oxidoreductase [Seohaeicola zhoushanensis]